MSKVYSEYLWSAAFKEILFKFNLTLTSKDERIEQLKNEIEPLKQSKKSNNPSNNESAETAYWLKNMHAVSKSGGSTEMITEIIEMFFIEQTMQALSTYNEKLTKNSFYDTITSF